MAIKLAAYEKLTSYENLALGIQAEDAPLPAWLPEPLAGEIARLRRLGDLSGKADEIHVLYPAGKGPKRVILCGLGDGRKLTLQGVRKAAGRVVKRAQALKLRELALAVESFGAERYDAATLGQALSMAATLAAYQFKEFKTKSEKEEAPVPLKLVLIGRKPSAYTKAVDLGETIAEAANHTRTLANQPGNKLFPQILANEARSLSRRYPALSVSVLPRLQLERAGFGALVAVGSGSSHPPVLIEVKYRGGAVKSAPIALVGKGITFDSGGICLKPSAKMEDMRYDMSGAAAVLGVMQTAARLRLPVNLVGIIPAAENLPSGTAYRPGDILTSLSGQTIEVLNTDAEGRLVLADALTYALRHKPECIVDLATLTGAVTVALGSAAIGLMSNREQLADELKAAGEDSGERVWQLPLWDEYKDLVKSDVADIANIGNKPGAGTIVGGVFLERFVGETPWAHLDIAGTAYGEGGPIYAKGATGVGVRLIVEWLRRRIG